MPEPRQRYPIGLALCVAYLVFVAATGLVYWFQQHTDQHFAFHVFAVTYAIVLLLTAFGAARRHILGVTVASCFFGLFTFAFLSDIHRLALSEPRTMIGCLLPVAGFVYLIARFRRLVVRRRRPDAVPPSVDASRQPTGG